MFRLSLPNLAICLAVTQLAHAGFNLNLQSNIAVYWGQNSYGQANSQQRLSVYCSNTKLNIIPLAFMNGIQTPLTNFANAGDNCTLYSGTSLLNCPQLEQDINICQTTYSKTIILSLGGATYTEGGFASVSAAQAAATNIWSLFGPSTNNANRPFRTAVVDGFDFDFESSTQNTAPFAQGLRDLMDTATAAGGKQYYLSAAPQCPYPDVAQNDILTNVALDFVMVQFYNNYCGVTSFTPGTQAQTNFNMDTWDAWAKTTSKNKNVRILLGVPANTGAGGGYLSAAGLASVIDYCKTFTTFGGVMMWDMSQMIANAGFLDGVFAALTSTATTTASTSLSTISSIASTTTTTTTTTATTTTTSSRSAGSDSTTTSNRSATSGSTSSTVLGTTSGTCTCPVPATVTVTATVFTTSGAPTQSNTVRTLTTPKTTQTIQTSQTSQTTRTTQTSQTSQTTQAILTSITTSALSQTTSVTSKLVDQWGRCGGQGYTGSTQCRAPYTCVYAGVWWSDCR